MQSITFKSWLFSCGVDENDDGTSSPSLAQYFFSYDPLMSSKEWNLLIYFDFHSYGTEFPCFSINPYCFYRTEILCWVTLKDYASSIYVWQNLQLLIFKLFRLAKTLFIFDAKKTRFWYIEPAWLILILFQFLLLF